MKKYSILFAIFFGMMVLLSLMVSCSCTIEIDRVQEKKGVFYLNNEIEPFDGKAVGYYDNGKKRVVTHFKKGKKHGMHQQWFPDGQIQLEIYFEFGNPIGPERRVSKEAEKEMILRDDRREGPWLFTGRQSHRKGTLNRLLMRMAIRPIY